MMGAQADGHGGYKGALTLFNQSSVCNEMQ
jgi:hypothetical protein